MAYLWVAIGGALGSMARYGCSGIVARLLGVTFPYGTLFVNVTGSFAIGVLGGFTTFSSFSYETLSLARSGNLTGAAANIVLSLVLCLIAVWLGFATVTAFSR